MAMRLCSAVVCVFCLMISCRNPESDDVDWPVYLGGPDRNHYSGLHQIDTLTVGKLKVAWEFHTGDPGEMQCSPIVVGNVLYGLTAFNRLFALNAATGIEL